MARLFGESFGSSRLISRFETTACTIPDRANPRMSAQVISQVMAKARLSALSTASRIGFIDASSALARPRPNAARSVVLHQLGDRDERRRIHARALAVGQRVWANSPRGLAHIVQDGTRCCVRAERSESAWQSTSLVSLPAGRLTTVWGAVESGVRATPVALLFALAARLPYFARSNFPLNDGGLFVAMSQDVLANHFALPAVTSYNAADRIPFGYPPLAFYIVAGLHALLGTDLLTLARWVPLVT